MNLKYFAKNVVGVEGILYCTTTSNVSYKVENHWQDIRSETTERYHISAWEFLSGSNPSMLSI